MRQKSKAKGKRILGVVLALVFLISCIMTPDVHAQAESMIIAITAPSIRFPFALLFCLICSAFLLLLNGDLSLKMFVQIYQIKHIDPVFFAVCICGLKITSGKLLGTIQMPVQTVQICFVDLSISVYISINHKRIGRNFLVFAVIHLQNIAG